MFSKPCSGYFDVYMQVLAWQTSWWTEKDHEIHTKGNLPEQLDFMLEELENILGQPQVEHSLALITCSKHGVTDSEMLDLLAFDDNFHSSTTFGTVFFTFLLPS